MNFAPGKMYTYSTSPGKGQTLCKVWLASVERRRCSNEAKTRKPLKLAAVPQNYNETISAASRLKFTILWGHVEEILLLNKFLPIVDTYLRRYSLTKLCDGAQMAIFGDFCVLYFSASRVQHVSDLHSKSVVTCAIYCMQLLHAIYCMQ